MLNQINHFLDGGISEGYNLYIKPTDSNRVVSVAYDTPELYRLRNAIQSKVDISADEVSFMQEFIDSEN